MSEFASNSAGRTLYESHHIIPTPGENDSFGGDELIRGKKGSKDENKCREKSL